MCIVRCMKIHLSLCHSRLFRIVVDFHFRCRTLFFLVHLQYRLHFVVLFYSDWTRNSPSANNLFRLSTSFVHLELQPFVGYHHHLFGMCSLPLLPAQLKSTCPLKYSAASRHRRAPCKFGDRILSAMWSQLCEYIFIGTFISGNSFSSLSSHSAGFTFFRFGKVPFPASTTAIATASSAALIPSSSFSHFLAVPIPASTQRICWAVLLEHRSESSSSSLLNELRLHVEAFEEAADEKLLHLFASRRPFSGKWETGRRIVMICGIPHFYCKLNAFAHLLSTLASPKWANSRRFSHAFESHGSLKSVPATLSSSPSAREQFC